MKKKVCIIGGSYLQLPLVMKCKDMGLETHCFAWDKGAVCKEHADFFYPISIVDKETILDKCREISIDAVLSIASDIAVITVNYIAEKLNLSGNPTEFTEITTNKFHMRNALSERGVPSPQYKRFLPEDEILGSSFHYPVIVKPTDRSGNRGVSKIENAESLQAAVSRAFEESFCKEVIVEEFIEGAEVSVEAISYKGRHYILQITDKVTTGAPYFVEIAHHQPSNLDAEIQNRIKEVVLMALDALHIKNGASHSELKIDPFGNVKVIEIGARMGGGFIGSDLVQLSTGYDFLKGVVEVALGYFNPPNIGTKNRCSGIFFITEETSGLLKYIREKQRYPQIVRAEIMSETLHHAVNCEDRSAYFIYQSEQRWNPHV